MGTDDTDPIGDDASSERAPEKPLTKFKQRVAGWRPVANKMGAGVATLAAVGAVLSGLTGYWFTYRTVVGEWFAPKSVGGSPTHVEPANTAPQSLRRSIVVMPFAMLGGDPAQDYLATALGQNLTTDLSAHIPGLLVIGQGSALTYKDNAIDPKQIGRDLGVRYILQGSLQRTGKEVRVNAQLVETATAMQVWAERFDSDGADILGLQDQIAGRIASSLGAAIIRDGAREAEKRKTKPDVTDLVFQGQVRLFLRVRSLESFREAEEFYRQALAIDHDNSDALIGLSWVLAARIYLYNSLMTPEQVASSTVEARRLADRGLDLQPRSGFAHFAKGRLFATERRWREAKQEDEIGLSLDPSFAVGYNNLASDFIALGEPDKAIRLVNEAIRRSPRDPAIPVWYVNLCRANVLLARWNDAIEAGLKARLLSPPAFSTASLGLFLAAAYAQKDEMDSARAELGRLPPGSSIASARDSVSQEAGYLRLQEITLLDGLRKAGLPEGL